MDGARSDSFTQGSQLDNYGRFMLPQLFEPWAAELLARAEVHPGDHVLDVASGLAPVARLAAAAAGPGGRVVASDISAPMLAAAAARPTDPGWAPIEYLECPATVLAIDNDSFDVVLCQQGLQFFGDRAAAVREMRRTAKPGGVVAVEVWAAEYPLGLFGAVNETLRTAGLAEPFPRAYETASYQMSNAELTKLFREAGLRDVTVEAVPLDAVWGSADEVTGALFGMPFGPLVAALPAGEQRQVRDGLARRLGAAADGVIVRTVSNVARGVK
jgi:ubiquinone/menaquinone biosynthesis C-methylase UbiE